MNLFRLSPLFPLFFFLACTSHETPLRNSDWSDLEIRREQGTRISRAYAEKELHGSSYFFDASGKLDRIEAFYQGHRFYAATCTPSDRPETLSGAPFQSFGPAQTLRYVQDPIALDIAVVDFPDSEEQLEMCLVGPDQSWEACEEMTFEANGIAKAVFSWDQPGYHQIGFLLRVRGRFNLVHERVSGYFLEERPTFKINM